MHRSPEENIRSEIAQIVSIPSGDRITEDKSRLNALEPEIQHLLSVGTMPLPIYCTLCNRQGVTGTQCTDDCSYVGGHNFVLFPTTLPHAEMENMERKFHRHHNCPMNREEFTTHADKSTDCPVCLKLDPHWICLGAHHPRQADATCSQESLRWEEPKPLFRTAEAAADKYRSVGGVLARNASAYEEVTNALRSIHKETESIPPFVVIDAPSGSGKTQLGFVLDSLGFRVLHFTLHPASGDLDQLIYLSMATTSRNIQRAISADLRGLSTDELSVHLLLNQQKPLRLVQYLFWSLFDEPNRRWDRCTASELSVTVSESTRVPVVVVDEVGNQRDSSGKIVENDALCLRYIRNLCRACRIPCVFMGTNSNAMNMVQAARGSRTSDPVLWCKLITRLPRCPESREALNLADAEATLRQHGHVALATFLNETSMNANPLFLSMVVDAILFLPEEQWQQSTGEVLDALLATTSTKLLRRKPQLMSSLGLRGQIALQLNMYREEAMDIQETLGQTILNFKSAVFVAVHFARLHAPRYVMDVYACSQDLRDGQESAPLAFNPHRNGTDSVLQRWRPTAWFPPATEDPWLYLICGGGMDGLHPPAFCLGSTDAMATVDALLTIMEGHDTSAECMMWNLNLSNNQSQKRSGEILEALASVAVVTASRRAGVVGMSLSCFLCRLAEELVLDSHHHQRVQVCWGEESSLAMLDQLLEAPVPYLGPFNTDWPASLLKLPNCHFGHFRRTRDAENVDFSISVPTHEASAAAAAAAVRAATTASSSRVAETVIVSGECKNYSKELDEDDTTQLLTRAVKKWRTNSRHRVQLAFVSSLSMTAFQKSSWKQWKKDNAQGIDLQVARVNLSRDVSGTSTLLLSLTDLSQHAASLDRGNVRCDLLVLFIPVEPWQGILTTVAPPPDSQVSSKKSWASLWPWVRK